MPIDPEIRLHIKEEIDKHKLVSNSTYAIKLVEKIVFYMVGAASIAVFGAVIKLVLIP